MLERVEYSRIAIAAAESLAANGKADFAVYLPGTTDGDPLLYREAGVGLTQPDFDRLRTHDVPFLYILSTDLRQCEAFLESRLRDLLNRPGVTPGEKARLVHQVGTSVARDLTGEPVSSENLARASYVVDNVIGSILNDMLVAAHMLHMAGHERSTASHMFVVSALAVALGVEVFGSDYEILRTLGLAGMMHDIGKLGISPEVLNKPIALTPEETQLIQQHPIESVRLLGDDPKVTPAVRQIILQHHEWMDGRGYPVGARGDELLPGSRIVSIVDSFHAMIGRRSYRNPLTPREANRALNTQAGRQFDPDMLGWWNALFDRCWSHGPPVLPIDQAGEVDEISSQQEHRPPPSRGEVFGARPKRFTCNARVMVKCVYAGRLPDTTCAPDEFAASVHDVSRGGLCIYSAYPMYRGEVVHVQVEKGGRHTWVRGTVAWCRQHDVNLYKTGLQFVQRISEREAHASVNVEGITTPEASAPESVSDVAINRPWRPRISTRDQTEMSREHALETLAEIADMRATTIEAEKTAVKLADSPDPEIRRKAIDALARIGTKPARMAIAGLLKDADPAIREHAVATAGTLQMAEAAYLLRQRLNDPIETVALRAAGALGQLGERTGLPLVTQALEGNGSGARLAARVFGEIVGHRFPANERGIMAARRYLAAKKRSLMAS